MKFRVMRIGVLLMALTQIISFAGDFLVPAAAEERIPGDAYVLKYAPDDLTEAYKCGQPYMYATPFAVEHTITDVNWNRFYSGTNAPKIFNLINTTGLESGREGAYASIPAYSADAAADIRENRAYRRINLEDTAYFKSGAAGKIRAVVLNSFPYVDTAALQVRANDWLRDQGLPKIVNLQTGEAILAAQTAIWSLTNGDHYTIDSHYAGWKALDENRLEDVIIRENAFEQETDNTARNVESLYTYLSHLEAVGPRHDAVSERTLENPTYMSEKDAEGTYTITVSVYVNTDACEGDSLILSAACGGQIQSRTITQAGSYSFTFGGMADRVEAELQISGTQSGGDVYLFDAEGEQDTSQPLVGYDNSTLPVQGKIVVSPDRILNIFKSTSEEDGSMPLANMVFDIYHVAGMEQAAGGSGKLSVQPTEEEIAKYKVRSNLVATLMTNGYGIATFNFTEAGLPDGVYMIVEQHNAATTGAEEPFFIAVPGMSGDGSNSYTLNINSRNVAEKGPDIRKDVTGIDNNSDTFDIGQPHTWIIRGDIPAGIGSAQKYRITDVFDSRLSYQKGSPVVRLYTGDGEELLLEEEFHYTLTEGSAADDEATIDRFSVSLTPAGMSYVAANVGSGDRTPEIRVYCNAAINENTGMGITVPNDAHLDYTNSAGIDYSADSDIPEVHTGGINLLKTDKDDMPQEGAVFMIAREATQAELEDESVIKEVLYADGKYVAAVFVDFYTAADMQGEKSYTAVTGEEGKATVYGLAYGTYYLMEIESPGDGDPLKGPITVSINEGSHLTKSDGRENEAGEIVDNTLHVSNARFILPDTGGRGTTAFTVAGAIIISSACLLILSNHKKKVW